MGIRFTIEDGQPTCVTEIPANRHGVYLDNWAIIELATRDEPRRDRFLNALSEGGELLFSWTNATELWGPQGGSADRIRSFLSAVGAHWFPLEMNPFEVARRECSGVSTEHAAVSETFVNAYFKQRAYEQSPEGKAVLDLSDAFFDLGAVVDWVHQERDLVRADLSCMDESLSQRIDDARRRYVENTASLDGEFPPASYDPQRPAAFALPHLLRTLVIDAKAFQFKRGDGADLCHAVLGAAYGSLATLDKQWKHRVEQLPRPNELARILSPPEVDEFVEILEALVA